MKVWVYEDEIWPDYELLREVDAQWPLRYEAYTEFPEELFERYSAARQSYISLRDQVRDFLRSRPA